MCDPNNSETINETSKHTTLVVYDISNNKRRYRMHKMLKSFGIRVQRSAFECVLDESKHLTLMKKIVPIINQTEDLLRIYRLPLRTEIITYGDIGKIENDDEYWII